MQNLNPPCAVCDVDSDGDGTADTADWIEAGTYTGVWWELQRRDTTWTAGAKHGATTARIKDYIDLAADAGARYVLAEGWNTNAGGSWTNQDFTTPMPDVDLDEVLRYGAAKGVGFVAHNETRGYVDYYDQALQGWTPTGPAVQDGPDALRKTWVRDQVQLEVSAAVVHTSTGAPADAPRVQYSLLLRRL